jgi:FkbM family methyltransferase
MRGYLFDDYQVEIDPRAVALGGSWQGAPRDGLPTAWDGDLLEFFYAHMPAECHFMDVGANTGSYCLLCALRPDATCVAFEPYPAVYEVLEANLALNGLSERVIVSPFALWDRYGGAILSLPGSGASGLACLSETPTRFTPIDSRVIRTRHLDNLNVGRLDMMKVDVEGAELMVLRGAAETLRRDHPALLVEYDERNVSAFGYEREEIIEFLSGVGYNCFGFPTLDGRDLWAT